MLLRLWCLVFFVVARLVVVASLAGPAIAADLSEPGASPWARVPQADVRLIAAAASTGTAASIGLGLHFRLKPHWKVYWRSPGDAGYPPALAWKDSENLAQAEISWPAPRRFSLQGIETAGYEDEVVLPITAKLIHPGQPLHLKAAVDFLICSEICVPQHVNLGLDLAGGDLAGGGASPLPLPPTSLAHLINRYAARVPGDGAKAGIKLIATTTTTSSSGGNPPAIEVIATADPPFQAPDLFVEGPNGMSTAAPLIRLEAGGHRAVLRTTVTAGTAPAGTNVTLTLVDGPRAMETAVVLAAAAPDPGTPGTTLLVMVGIALMGGFVLNLMPCVLPVLSLKFIGLVGMGGAGRRRIRVSFIASAAGILASFIALAAAAVAVKATGTVVGWGVQFQHPLFLAAMIVVLALFAANLWGLFEIGLPSWLADTGASVGSGSHSHSHVSHFLTGAFATLLATPCSAPFLGTAIGFALARGPAEILLIFTALGLGMASPYLVVAAMPALAGRLPRPGRWMVWLRRLMGVALGATSLWLATVLAVQIGEASAVVVESLMVMAVVALWVRLRLPSRLRPVAVGVASVCAALAFIAPAASPAKDVEEARASHGIWRPFDLAAIPGEVAAGRSVLVDVTADWCVTCQVNKAVVLNRGAVAKRLGGSALVAMRADWTRPNDAIAVYLASFGRYGIPFNAVYGPGAPDGLALPELLTEQAVLTAMDRAALRR
ncbi:MAG: thioredoxin family protein [Alphaproteobacteria bacterium]|nr:thioredoxin family protein [Alphaproteobacteria bacterium]